MIWDKERKCDYMSQKISLNKFPFQFRGPYPKIRTINYIISSFAKTYSKLILEFGAFGGPSGKKSKKSFVLGGYRKIIHNSPDT